MHDLIPLRKPRNDNYDMDEIILDILADYCSGAGSIRSCCVKYNISYELFIKQVHANNLYTSLYTSAKEQRTGPTNPIMKLKVASAVSKLLSGYTTSTTRTIEKRDHISGFSREIEVNTVEHGPSVQIVKTLIDKGYLAGSVGNESNGNDELTGKIDLTLEVINNKYKGE